MSQGVLLIEEVHREISATKGRKERRIIKGMAIAISFSLIAVPTARADDSDSDSKSAREPVTVSVPIRTIDTPDKSGQNGILVVRVGRAAPISVMVDTGIVGLVLFGKPAGLKPTGKRTTTEIRGSKIPGAIFTAPVTIGGVTTTQPVTISVVNTSNPYIQQWKNRGISGIIGLGTGDGGNMTNILKSMPGALGLRWSIHFKRNIGTQKGRPGALILGAEPPVDPTMSFRLPYVSQDINGANNWDDHQADGCWTFGVLREQCVPTWFDSGFTLMRVLGRDFSRVPDTSTNLVKPGTRVKLASAGSAFFGHKFIAGRTGSRNLVRLIPRGKPTINTGNSFYFDYTLTYDLAVGTVSLGDSNLKGN